MGNSKQTVKEKEPSAIDNGGKKEVDQDICFFNKGDASTFLHPQDSRLQSLKGFEEHYTDIVDYILRCTHRIWEEGSVGTIGTHYLNSISVKTSSGEQYGRDSVIGSTALGLAAYPDMRLYADDVIWAGNDQSGFHTSHRLTVTGTNTGYSGYGAPGGRKIKRTAIANCLIRKNLIIDEWVARDEMSVVLQLGLNPWKIAAESYADSMDRSFSPAVQADLRDGQDLPEVYRADGAESGVEDFVKEVVHEIWNRKFVHLVKQYYADSFQYFGPAGRNYYGPAAYKAHVLSFLAMFPDLKVTVEHVYANGNSESGFRVAIRWIFQGTHEQWGPYGRPTGKQVKLMGISHFHVFKNRITRDYSVFDEMDLLKQIYRPDYHEKLI